MCTRKQHIQLVELLFSARILIVLLIAIAAPLHANDLPDSRERLLELDGEFQAIKEDILEINRDRLLLEKLALYLPVQQPVVLLSTADGGAV